MKFGIISPYLDVQSVGVRSLSSSLKRAGHDVKIVFLRGDFLKRYSEKSLNELVQILKGTDVIGISLMTNFFDNSVQVTEKIRQNLDSYVIWGGTHPTIRPEECLGYANAVAIGESEETIVEFAEKMANDQDFTSVLGMWFKDKDGHIIRNCSRPLIQNLDSIPYLDYDNEDHYVLSSGTIQPMNNHLLNEYAYSEFMTMPTRGCPYNCTYCVNNTLNQMGKGQKIVRKRSVNHVIGELTWMRNKMPFFSRVKFDDDCFFLYKPHELKDFSAKYKSKVGLPLFITGATPETLTREKLAPLVDANLQMIRMGIQSAAEKTKQLYKRCYPNDKVVRAAKLINEFKDRITFTQYDMILDCPWEGDEELIESLLFLTTLPTPYDLRPFSLSFFPGTHLYDMAKKDNIVKDDLTDVYRKHYHRVKKTYLNRLFLLQQEAAKWTHGISTGTMRLLTSRTIRRWKLNWILYTVVRLTIDCRIKFKRFKHLVWQGLKDLRKMDMRRLKKYLKEKYAAT
jgi:radical SAM superfamily enzyme YgiQ (UPF0313 family)|tara:strand:- start:737 stop:2266 length:1530 start_codon:yes stop_codon:yes gene_type:complete